MTGTVERSIRRSERRSTRQGSVRPSRSHRPRSVRQGCPLRQNIRDQQRPRHGPDTSPPPRSPVQSGSTGDDDEPDDAPAIRAAPSHPWTGCAVHTTRPRSSATSPHHVTTGAGGQHAQRARCTWTKTTRRTRTCHQLVRTPQCVPPWCTCVAGPAGRACVPARRAPTPPRRSHRPPARPVPGGRPANERPR
jgi:hypothetical protein